MNQLNSIDLKHRASARRFHPVHRLLPALAVLALLATPVCRAALPIFATSTQKVPFTSIVSVEKTTAPEKVLFSGQFDVVTSVLSRGGGLCTAQSPCSSSGSITVFTSGITGIGLTSGLKYLLVGAGSAKLTLPLPGSAVVDLRMTVVPPRSIRPLSVNALAVPLKSIVTFLASGRVLQAAVPPIGLAGWWQAEGTAADALGINHGTLSSTEPVSFVPGLVGQAFNFNGAGFVEVPSSPLLEPANVTATAWVRAGFSPGTFAHILSKGAAACDGASYAFSTGGNGGLTFYVSDGVNFSLSPGADSDIWDGEWHLAVGTFDGTTVRLYVDGVEVGTGSPAPFAINYSLADNDKFYIGAYRGTCELRFAGDVDEVQIYGRALAPAEIQGLFNAGL